MKTINEILEELVSEDLTDVDLDTHKLTKDLSQEDKDFLNDRLEEMKVLLVD